MAVSDFPKTDDYVLDRSYASSASIWLAEIARKLPSTAQLDGLDIDLSQVPPKKWLPPNINFQIYDVHDDPPAHLVEKYDIVHVRHLALVIKQNDPTLVLRNLLRLLSLFTLSIVMLHFPDSHAKSLLPKDLEGFYNGANSITTNVFRSRLSRNPPSQG
ncbi:MAG: hypothetical protein Q9194_005591 [Teloschistes cf. exilis]